MTSSEDEAEALPLSVSNYHFVDDKDEPTSFSVLPVQWSQGEKVGDKKVEIFLHGVADNGLQKIYKQVIAWKFDLWSVKPEISVLSKKNNWIKLQKPRKSFEDVIRSILITVHCLHFVLRNPEISEKALWDSLSKFFSLYEVRPSENDLVDHTSLISEAVKRNEALATKFLLAFLKKKPRKRRLPDEEGQAATMSRFIVDDMDDYTFDDAEEDGSNEDDELFDSVCSFCDNGGDLVCCEGSCLRSFHATEEGGEESLCESLGYTEEEYQEFKASEHLPFLCKNCKYKQHQCFICGKLGSSDKDAGAEVFRCVSATCGQFYHPRCVAKLLHLDNEVSAEHLEKKIADGESFICPIHKCSVCKQGENKKDPQLQFAVCRRCPKSYHRKCLPTEISFGDPEKTDIITRAWENLLPNRILIYCLNHEIDEKIGTPVRHHIKFPDVEEKRTSFGKKKTSIEETRRKQTSKLFGDKKKIESKTRVRSSEEFHQGTTAYAASKQTKKSSSVLKVGGNKNTGKLFSRSSIGRKLEVDDASKKELKSSMAEEKKSSLGVRLYAYMDEMSEQVKQQKQSTPDRELNKSALVKPTTKNLSGALPPLDADTERRLLNIMEEAESLISIEDVRKKHKVPSTHVSSSKNPVEKTITEGKVEGLVVAVRAALRKLEEGCSFEDAEAVCGPELLGQIFKWKSKLKVYLNPFLYGMRYTSFGRHFTKVEKLQEIVNKLHWYVQPGDMIVDFCCGANDFSILMRKKLDNMGKKCLYKNYDVIEPKNDFNFERRDWMTVQPKELPTGSKLIMGLNPPFGIKACLANKFIDKALEFNPKLLILIVPLETQRLDEKKPYNLVWEDDHFLSGKSFYLPGSVDVKDNQMEQWNVRPPVLYLWSHSDWSAKHRAIAESQGHTFRQEEAMEEGHSESLIPDHPKSNPDEFFDHTMGDHGGYGNISDLDHGMGDHGNYGDIPDRAMEDHGDSMLTGDPMETENSKGCSVGVVVTGGHKESSVLVSSDKQGHRSDAHGTKSSSNKSSKRSQNRKKHKQRARGETSTTNKWDGGRHPVREMCNDLPPYADVGVNSYLHVESSMSGSRTQFGSVYGDEMFRRYSVEGDEHYSRFPSRSVTDHDQHDMLRRDSGIRSQVRLYGQQDLDFPESHYIGGGHDPRYGQIGSHTPFSSTYGPPGLGAEPSYRMNPLGTQWHTPPPDEFHHTRMSALGSELPPMFGGTGDFDPRLPHHGLPGGGPVGFAPGPHQTYRHHPSAGWLND